MATILRLALVAGVALVAYGLWLIYQPATFIAVGGALMAAGLFFDDGKPE